MAERVLSDAWGAGVELAEEQNFGRDYRTRVYRYAVRSGSPDLPKSVIVKRAVAVHSESYEINAPNGPAWRLFNDWAGLQFLYELAGSESPAPRYYAGSRETGLIVMEDLGPVKRLDQLLLGKDLKAAVDGLMAFMATVGRMHAMTIGQRKIFDQLREGLGPRQAEPEPKHVVDVQARKLREFARGAGVNLPSDTETDFETLRLFLDKDNPFMAYSHNDLCPDNCLIVDNGIKLVDFETSSYRHALLDGVYGRIHFPTCWCVNQLPPSICEQMEEVYRHELAKGCPEATDDKLFKRAVVEACAWQLLSTMYTGLLNKDLPWGISTQRQRIVVRLDRFAEVSTAVGHLKLLGATARNLAASLRKQWQSGMDEMPLYPAFR